jgi:hypothetical protein
MKILDYEQNRTLNDVAIYLTHDEATELMQYLQRLVEKPAIHTIHLSEIRSDRMEKDLAIAIDPLAA